MPEYTWEYERIYMMLVLLLIKIDFKEIIWGGGGHRAAQFEVGGFVPCSSPTQVLQH